MGTDSQDSHSTGRELASTSMDNHDIQANMATSVSEEKKPYYFQS
jgi:hypothetical protein